MIRLRLPPRPRNLPPFRVEFIRVLGPALTYRQHRAETHLLLEAASLTSSADNDNKRSDHEQNEQDQGRDGAVQCPLDTRCMAACESNQHVRKSGHSVELSRYNRSVLMNRDSIRNSYDTIHIRLCFAKLAVR